MLRELDFRESLLNPNIVAKEGIRGLSRVAATEWGPDGININVVCPLAMTEGLEKWREQYPEVYAQTIKAVPMGRVADPDQDIGRFLIIKIKNLPLYFVYKLS